MVRREREPEQRVLVVGCGFLGSHIVGELAAGGQPPRVLTRSAPAAGHLERLPGLDLVCGDAVDSGAVEAALDGIDHVVFCAGGLLPAHAEQEPELDARLTLGPVETMLDALRLRPRTTFTYLSSGGTIYGDPEVIPTGEDQPTRPVGSYGRIRLEAERLIASHAAQYGISARVLRCATVYGEHQRPDRGQGAVVTFLRRVECGEPIFVYGDGLDTRDYIYAGDVARVVAGLIGRDDGPAVLNVGSGEGTTVLDLVAMVEAQVGRRANVVRQPVRPFDVRHIVLDTSRLRDLVPVRPVGLELGIARTHRWLLHSSEPALLDQVL